MRNLFNDVNENVYSVIGQMGAKNLIPYPYYDTVYEAHGITWTVNADGSVTADGTATENEQFILNNQLLDVAKEGTDLILSGCPSGGSQGTYKLFVDKYVSSYSNVVNDFGEGGQFEMPTGASRVRVGAVIFSGAKVSNLTFKPMLRLAADSDDTYQPYAKTNRQLTEDKAELESVRDYVNELGVKNLIPYPYYDTTKTKNGITFTDNGDGTVTVDTVNTGATADTAFELTATAVFTSLIHGEKYVVSCKNLNSSSSGYRIRVYVKNGSTQILSFGVYDDEEKEFTYPNNATGVNVQIFVPSGAIMSAVVFKPMLCLASDINDDTYVPYAKTNRQLTVDTVNKKTTIDSFYGTSNTPAATAAKVITVVDSANNFSLRPGVLVTAKFDYENTANNPTFNVNGTGAKPVSYNNAVVSTESLWAGGDSAPSLYVYDGTNWVLLAYSSYSTAQSVIVNPSAAPTGEGSIWIETT